MALLGAHVSIAGGIEKAPERGSEIGAEAIQIFTANQRQWKSKPLRPETSKAFREAMQQMKVSICFSHAGYLINLCAHEKTKHRMSMMAMTDELERCQSLGLPFVVVHPGSHGDRSKSWGIKQIADSLNIIFNKRPDIKTRIVLETTAGQGTSLGNRFEHLRDIIEQLDQPSRFGICFDTAHVFAAGYDIQTPTGLDNVLSEFDSVIGFDQLAAFHLNDTVKECGSRVDRHQKIGKGNIGLEVFRQLVGDSRFKRLPFVLETPVKHYSEYEQEIKLLRSSVH